METKTRLVRRAFGVMVFLALGFGASQAFAIANPVYEWESCNPWYYEEVLSCQETCVAVHGTGTQSTCSPADGYPYPVCQCIR